MSDILGPEVGYISIMEEYVTQLEEASHKPRNPLRPYNSGECERALAYSYAAFKGSIKDVSTPVDPRTRRIFSMGHKVEAALVKEFRDAFRQINKEGGDAKFKYDQQTLRIMTLPDEEIIEGKNDGGLLIKSDKYHKCLVDFKSKKDKWATFFTSKWDEDNEFFLKHGTLIDRHKDKKKQKDNVSIWINDINEFYDVLMDKNPFYCSNFSQLNLYMYDEDRFFHKLGFDHLALIYQENNNFNLREVRWAPSEKLANRTKDKFSRACKAGTSKDFESANKDFQLGTMKCSFCDWATQCWGLDEDQITKAFYDTLPNKRWPKDTDRLEFSETLEDLHKSWMTASQKCEEASKIEQEIIKLLDAQGVSKVRFSNDMIYDVKRYKTGGAGNGPRLALKRGKL